MPRKSFNERGATLVELVFSIAVMLVLAASFYQLLISFYQNYQTQDAIAEMQQEGRVAIDLISREIAQAGYDPTGKAFENDSKTSGSVETFIPSQKKCKNESSQAESILEAAPTYLHLLADLGGKVEGGIEIGDGDVQDDREDIRYEWVGESGKNSCGRAKTKYTLYRDSGSHPQEVAENIVSFKLTYLDQNGMELYAPPDKKGPLDPDQRASIRKIVIEITAGADLKMSNQKSPTRSYTREVWLKNL